MAGSVLRTGGRERAFSFSIDARAPRLLLPWRTVFADVRGRVDLDGIARGAPCTGWLELSPVRRRMMRYVLDFRAEDGRRFRFDASKHIRLWWLPSWTVLRGYVQDDDDARWGQAEVRFSVRRQLLALLASMRPWRAPVAHRANTSELMAPRWRGQPGRLEVWYATITDPCSGEGLWIHHELVAPRDGGAARQHGWAAAFPPDAGPIVGRFAGQAIDTPGPGDGLAVFAAAGATVRDGALVGAAGSLRWDLRYRDDAPPLYTFPAWAWERELLPAAQVVPAPTARFSGTVHVGERVLELRDAPGAVARVYGQGNAERWGWLHADLGGGDVLEIVTAVSRRRLLRRLAPASFVALRLHGHDWPRSRLLAALLLKADLDPPHGFSVRGTVGRRRLRAEVRLHPASTVTLDYDETAGVGPRCANSERATLELVLERRCPGGHWRVEHEWTRLQRAHAEVGWRR
jgi:hypothetical protein